MICCMVLKPTHLSLSRQINLNIYKFISVETFCFESLILKASEDHLRQHYADLSHLPFFPGLVKHMASGPVVAMVRGAK